MTSQFIIFGGAQPQGSSPPFLWSAFMLHIRGTATPDLDAEMSYYLLNIIH